MSEVEKRYNVRLNFSAEAYGQFNVIKTIASQKAGKQVSDAVVVKDAARLYSWLDTEIDDGATFSMENHQDEVGHEIELDSCWKQKDDGSRDEPGRKTISLSFSEEAQELFARLKKKREARISASVTNGELIRAMLRLLNHLMIKEAGGFQLIKTKDNKSTVVDLFF